MMDVPEKTNHVWRKLLDGSLTIRFDYMALNLLIFNQRNKVCHDPAETDNAVETLYDFFKETCELPRVQKAIETLSNV